MSGCESNKDGKVKDDGYIYMVLEYGEIDLAHMLSQKWKELDDSKLTLDENWLRFYFQQILLAVKTIHEERIVHSDLKPANFLLVRGSLKLIDFGIAKAIMSDTTNIQRDSQVGTLSYMSPEAFMCNETDAQGNIIKCGRPSDIWSLGCILYQMVYGRSPFADYKTFWAKFKVVTDPDHKIRYEPLSNPRLLDLMKRCLAWDRDQRWRIPQLLQHPFLVPPVSLREDKHSALAQLVSEFCTENPKALMSYTRLEQLFNDPLSYVTTEELVAIEKKRVPGLFYEMKKLCGQLEELASSELGLK
ncbi:serine/threonine-protein kinase MPS1-like [Bidens hawaiensis]|uniref:serine/threonine-protein kinase MPS1-like n=1 Tax=Bidens hawaiensis TaxID=980011 RepID=UPI0040495242